MLFDLNKYPFNKKDIKYPIYLSIFWYICVIIPYEKYTKKYLYPFLSNETPLKIKLLIFSSIFGINLSAGYIGSQISKIKASVKYIV